MRAQFPANALVHRGELLPYVTSDRIRSNAQLEGALEYLGKVWCKGSRLKAMPGCGGSVAGRAARRCSSTQALHVLLAAVRLRASIASQACATPQVGSEPIDVAEFEEAAGVGVEVTAEQVQAAVAACVQEHRAKLEEER